METAKKRLLCFLHGDIRIDTVIPIARFGITSNKITEILEFE